MLAMKPEYGNQVCVVIWLVFVGFEFGVFVLGFDRWISDC